MSGFWRGLMAGGIIAAAVSMYINPHDKRRNILEPKRRKRTARMFQGASRTVKELMK